jgi:hypothetical protein
VLLGIFLIAIVAVLAMPEPATGSRGPISLPPRVGVPRQAGGTFAVGVPAVVATWALGALYFSLGRSLVEGLVGSQNLLWGGLAVFLLAGLGAASAVVVRASSPPRAMLVGSLVVLAGLAVTFAAIATTSARLFFVGIPAAGTSWGPTNLGAFRTMSALAPPGERAGLVSAIYVVAYLSFSVPALIAGVATSQFGLHGTALVYSGVMVVLVAAAAAGSFLLRRRTPSGRTAPTAVHAEPLPGPCTVPPPSQLSGSAGEEHSHYHHDGGKGHGGGAHQH